MCTWMLTATLLIMETTSVHQLKKKHSVPPHTGAPLSQEKERSPDTATTWTDPENTMLRKAADTGHTGCDSTGGKRPEQADRQTELVVVGLG